jgi:hypothetical protein
LQSLGDNILDTTFNATHMPQPVLTAGAMAFSLAGSRLIRAI